MKQITFFITTVILTIGLLHNANDVQAVALGSADAPLFHLDGDTGAVNETTTIVAIGYDDGQRPIVETYHDGVDQFVYVTYGAPLSFPNFDQAIVVSRCEWTGTFTCNEQVFLTPPSPSDAYTPYDMEYVSGTGLVILLSDKDDSDAETDSLFLIYDSDDLSTNTTISFELTGDHDDSPNAFVEDGGSYWVAGSSFATGEGYAIELSSSFPTTNPSITTVGLAPYSALSSITETTNGVGIVEYQLTPDGTNYYYHNGSTWTTESGGGYPTETNSAAEINTNISSFTATGNLGFRAFLNSDGSQDTQIEEVSFSLASATPLSAGTADDAPDAYTLRWFPMVPIPISVKPTPGTSDSLDFTFSTRIGDDDNPLNDPASFTLWDSFGNFITDSGIHAIPKTTTLTLTVDGLNPNTRYCCYHVSARNGSGTSAYSTAFPAAYTGAAQPTIEVLVNLLSEMIDEFLTPDEEETSSQ